MPRAGYSPTTPTQQSATVVAGQDVKLVFGSGKPGPGRGPGPDPKPDPKPASDSGELCVFSFFDTNADGRQDEGELGLAGSTFRIVDAQGAVVATLTTEEKGACTKLSAGPYTVLALRHSGLVSTTDAKQFVTVAAGRVAHVAFGHRKP